MILISYPHYTCGGFLCNIYNKEFNGFADHGGMDGEAHSIFKTRDDGKSPYTSIEELINIRLTTWESKYGKLPEAVGTHYPADKMPLHMFDSVINVTTVTSRSRMYRWLRVYHHYFMETSEWKSLRGIDLIDKARETAKQYLKPVGPVDHKKVYNVEFSDIVDCNTNCYNNIYKLNEEVFQELQALWAKKNSFLYESNIWDSDAIKRYTEAEYEINARTHYKYA